MSTELSVDERPETYRTAAASLADRLEGDRA